MSRIVKGQVCVTGEWHSFRVLMSLSDARQLVAEIQYDTAREKAADAVAPEKNERITARVDDMDSVYERLACKVKYRLGHPKKRVYPDRRATKPVTIEGQLTQADFRIEAIYRCK